MNDDRITELAVKVADLEHDLKLRDDKIKELRTELDDATELTGKLREQEEDWLQERERWMDAFEMRDTGDGHVEWKSAIRDLIGDHNALIGDHNKLVRRHNRLVRERWPRPMGRPLAASDEQVKEVQQHHKAGMSLRAIAAETGVTLATVRTIVKGVKRAQDQRRREYDRLRAARYRARKKAIDALPAKVVELQKTGAALVKAAKGLGR